jgi:two-component system chemotaxis response regulator CheB
VAKDKAIGVILTGMGKDGAQGLLDMKNKGAYTLGQNEATCVVYGMPMVAYDIEAVSKQLALSDIPREICRYLSINMCM